MEIDPLSAMLRALSFIALFQAAGAALFLVLFGRLISASESAIRCLGVASALIAMALLLAQYALEAARMSGELSGVMDPALQALVLHSSTATALAGRLAGLALICVALASRGSASQALSVIGVMLIVGAFALMGHISAHPQRGLLSILLVTHLLVVTFWFGALVPLWLASSRESAAVAGAAINAFSSIALWLVPALLLAGLLIATALLRGLAGLRTTYGQLLLVKLAAFVVLMGLAALNKWRLGPAVGRGDRKAAMAFRHSLTAEYALICGVLSVTAVLTTFYSPD